MLAACKPCHWPWTPDASRGPPPKGALGAGEVHGPALNIWRDHQRSCSTRQHEEIIGRPYDSCGTMNPTIACSMHVAHGSCVTRCIIQRLVSQHGSSAQSTIPARHLGQKTGRNKDAHFVSGRHLRVTMTHPCLWKQARGHVIWRYSIFI